MDIKIDGITKEILQEALAQAKVGRAQIMDCMLGAIPAPRDHLSKYAPKMHVMHIDPEQIRDVIGRGGETINEIIENQMMLKLISIKTVQWLSTIVIKKQSTQLFL